MDSDSLFPAYHGSNRHHFQSVSNSTPFRLDEGFSEDASSQDENGRHAFERLQEWIMAQSEETRMEIAYEILHSLRTSNIAAVVERLTPLLHMDPLEKLPPEITSEVFSYLDAPTLLTASLASHTWRGRIFDSRLWQRLYAGQGWGIDTREVQNFENLHTSLVRSEFKKARGQHRGSDGGQPQLKKRVTSNWLESRGRQTSTDVAQWREQHGVVEADTDAQSENGDHEMQDAPVAPQESPQRPNKRHSQDSGDEMDIYADVSSTLAQLNARQSANSHDHPFRPRLTRDDASGNERVNWSYLYKQRQRLEENWIKGRFTNFQLPDPLYPHEAHGECVYTIQFYGKWLVSGSRDKTLRVWDLETRRLRGKPLTGHSQSVLCLQFDPTEDEDVIISGSSDSSVIVWKFSTGQKIFEIPSAHEESVLNLRFDKRYLVTCSKDKKIKVWNRKQLSPMDPDYPRVAPTPEGAKIPSYILDIGAMEPSLLEARLANGTIKALRPYTHLMTFIGHNAAVNAIQINGDLIVSASGDRLIKIWNVKTGRMVRSLHGHHKGIACVQFDSKRIVSGSSDNTVRIFDPTTGSEVAELKGHTNLVRTVQAGFSDLPGSEEDDILKARAAELKYDEDVAAGLIVDDRTYSRRVKNGELGTSRITFGSKLPPGGGGSRWGKIVSGSYDESIIIWRKNAQGDWVVGQTLRQEAAVRASSEQQLQQPAPLPPALAPQAPQMPQANAPLQLTAPGGPNAPVAGGSANQPLMSPGQIMQQAVNTSFASLGAGISNVMGIARNLNTPLASWNVPPRSSSGGQAFSSANVSAGPFTQQAIRQMTTHTQNIMANAVQQAINEAISESQQQAQTFHQQATNPTELPPPPTQASSFHQIIDDGGTQHDQHQPQPPQQQLQPILQPQPQPQPQSQNQTNVSVSRVFKLQFDARRIVCCSQDSRIIGWDFANGDPEIMESSRFFLGP